MYRYSKKNTQTDNGTHETFYEMGWWKNTNYQRCDWTFPQEYE